MEWNGMEWNGMECPFEPLLKELKKGFFPHLSQHQDYVGQIPSWPSSFVGRRRRRCGGRRRCEKKWSKLRWFNGYTSMKIPHTENMSIFVCVQKVIFLEKYIMENVNRSIKEGGRRFSIPL